MKELIDILEVNYSPEEVIQLLNEFDEDKLKDYALMHDICPLCGGGLYTHRWDEKREWWGSIVFEPLSELKCQNCGETY